MTQDAIVVLAGGLCPEREVSIRSGRRVSDALREQGIEAVLLDVDAALLATLAADPPQAVVPLLHGAPGEDGALREVLDSLRIPYVGSRPSACRIAFDKPVAKSLVAAAGLRTPQSMVLAQATFRELGAGPVLDAVIARLGLPLLVKPTSGGSSLGTSVVTSADQLPAAMVASFAYGPVALVEQLVVGTEVAVGVLDDGTGPRALPVVEIRPDGGFYDYAARYTAGSTEFVVPASLPDDVLQECAAAAVTAHQTLGLSHWSRTDLIIDAAGAPWFLEVNVAPGMTETSTYPQALAAAGLDLGAVVQALVTQALPEPSPRRG
jgi:D-alanine-D-alanine ligase